jgi:hypothetical protein
VARKQHGQKARDEAAAEMARHGARGNHGFIRSRRYQMAQHGTPPFGIPPGAGFLLTEKSLRARTIILPCGS